MPRPKRTDTTKNNGATIGYEAQLVDDVMVAKLTSGDLRVKDAERLLEVQP